MKRILVTGGAGFIGSELVRHIITATPDSVLVADKLTYAGNLDSLEPVAGDERYHFQRLDICDGPALDRLLQTYRPDLIMHLAAESHVDRSIDAGKIERELGWLPRETFDSGLRKTVQWYLSNPAWWRRVQDGTYAGERLGLAR